LRQNIPRAGINPSCRTCRAFPVTYGVRGRKSHAEERPEVVDLARRLHKQGMTYRAISAELERAGPVNERGKVVQDGSAAQALTMARDSCARVSRPSCRSSSPFAVRSMNPHLPDGVGLYAGQPRQEMAAAPPQHEGVAGQKFRAPLPHED